MKTDAQNLVDSGSFFFPELTNSAGQSVESLYNITLFISFILFVGIIAFSAYVLVKYRRTKLNQKAEKQITHNLKLEIIWTVLPLFVLMFLFYYGYKGFINMHMPPSDSMEIRITAKKWLWEVEYPNDGIKTLNEIVVPIGVPVKLIMSSSDVLHSFFVPNFRIKRDVVPNRYTRLWFEAVKEGMFQIFCTEYCGDGHSNMLGIVKAVPLDEFEEWKIAGSADLTTPLDKLGEKLYVSKACNTCHSTDGSKMVGPTWKGVYGSKEELADGTYATVNDNYLRESIVNPQTKVVKGYQPVMPTYAGLLSDREINALIEYIKTIK